MQMRANVKPLVHWAIYKGYKIRYTGRSATHVQGVLTTPNSEQSFNYDSVNLIITVADQQIAINQHGWELSQDADRASYDRARNDPEDQ
jgi:hypothetical protein